MFDNRYSQHDYLVKLIEWVLSPSFSTITFSAPAATAVSTTSDLLLTYTIHSSRLLSLL